MKQEQCMINNVSDFYQISVEAALTMNTQRFIKDLINASNIDYLLHFKRNDFGIK